MEGTLFTLRDEVLLTRESDHLSSQNWVPNFSRKHLEMLSLGHGMRERGSLKAPVAGKVRDGAHALLSFPPIHLLWGSTFGTSGRGPEGTNVAKRISSAFPRGPWGAAVGSWQQAGYASSFRTKK